MITACIHETRRLFHFHLSFNETLNDELSGRASAPSQTKAQNDTIATPKPYTGDKRSMAAIAN